MINKNLQHDLLLKLRNRLCAARHVEPFKIFTESNIAAVIEAQPHTLEELGRVKGFPADGRRIKCYVEAILKIMNAPGTINDFRVTGSGDDSKVVTELKCMECFN